MSNQPRTRLHSQLDPGSVSRGSKIADREPITIHPDDAAARGIGDGDVVRVWNDRGSCLAGVIVSDVVIQGVVQPSTGAWFDPEHPGRSGGLDKHGNPNVLPRDLGTSRPGTGQAARSSRVAVWRGSGAIPQ